MLIGSKMLNSLLLLLIWLCDPARGLGPITLGASLGAALIGSAVYNGWNEGLKCRLTECCGLPYVRNDNVPHLESEIESRIFGQHLVKSIVSRGLKAHLKKEQPGKALVISFHGMTGTGKNYVSKFIADSLYAEGMKSQYVHLFIATYHFPHQENADIYKLQLQEWIRGNVSNCDRSLFIFDEMDKMPEGMIDSIKPFIDHHEDVMGVDFRRSIFIFLSNTGGKQITDRVYQFWEEGKKREDIKYQDLEELVNKGAFNEKGGLYHSTLIEKSLVDHYIPFLPLERSHVKECIKKEILDRNKTLNDQSIDEIADGLTYWPKDIQLYSTTGCKRVSQKVDLKLEELEEEQQEEEESLFDDQEK